MDLLAIYIDLSMHRGRVDSAAIYTCIRTRVVHKRLDVFFCCCCSYRWRALGRCFHHRGMRRENGVRHEITPGIRSSSDVFARKHLVYVFHMACVGSAAVRVSEALAAKKFLFLLSSAKLESFFKVRHPRIRSTTPPGCLTAHKPQASTFCDV